MKICIRCKKDKSIDDFHAHRTTKDKLTTECKECFVESARERLNKKDSKIPSHFLWRSVRNTSRRKKLPFNLLPEDLVVPKVCPILGIPLIRSKKISGNTPSVDKIDPSKGYVKGNVQVVSHRANAMKSNATPEELIKFSEWVQRIYAKTLPN